MMPEYPELNLSKSMPLASRDAHGKGLGFGGKRAESRSQFGWMTHDHKEFLLMVERSVLVSKSTFDHQQTTWHSPRTGNKEASRTKIRIRRAVHLIELTFVFINSYCGLASQ